MAAIAAPASGSEPRGTAGSNDALKSLEVINIPAGSGLTKTTRTDFEEGEPYVFRVDGEMAYDSRPDRPGSEGATYDPFYMFECHDGDPSNFVWTCPDLPDPVDQLKANGEFLANAINDGHSVPYNESHDYTLSTDKLNGRLTFESDLYEGVTGVWTIEVFSTEDAGKRKTIDFSVRQNGLPLNPRPGQNTSTTKLDGVAVFDKLKKEGKSTGSLNIVSGNHSDVLSAGSFDPDETTTDGFKFGFPGRASSVTYTVKGNGKKTLVAELGVDDSSLPFTECLSEEDEESLTVVLKDDKADDTLDFEPGNQCRHNEKFKSGQGGKLKVNISKGN